MESVELICGPPARTTHAGCKLRRTVLPALLAAIVALAVPAKCGDVIISEIMYSPASLDAREEFVELFNRGTVGYNLSGWRFTAGVRFTLPDVVLMPGQYLTIAADTETFRRKHPGSTNVVGNWEGRLSNNGEKIALEDAFGREQDAVTYANQGDWGERRRGPDDKGHRGWVWSAAHDGGGVSLELVNALLTNKEGQNWGPSIVMGGTPGAPNSIARTNAAPIIRSVTHSPAVPRPTQPVSVTAQVLDESVSDLVVSLFHRTDGAPVFAETQMLDDGKHADGAPGDGLYGAILSAQSAGTVIEFYVSAADAEGNKRTWPAPVQPEGTQAANCLYQVSDEVEPDGRPFYRLVTTETESRELAEIGNMAWYWSSDAQMNATFVSTESGESEVRYLVGLRMRGTTSRDPSLPAKSRRVNFVHDRPWRGRRAINLNGLNPHSQVLAGALCRLAGVPAAQARFVQLRENNRQPAPLDVSPYGWYAEVEVFDDIFVERQFPLDANGNLYRADGGNLDYLGEERTNYLFGVTPAGAVYVNYTKETNTAEDDWSDLIGLTRVLNTAPPGRYAVSVRNVADLDQWMTYFAVFTMLASTETSLATGSNGDFHLYRGLDDPRFRIVARDLDSTFGMEGGLYASIHRATNSPAINRLLTCPEFAPRYHSELQRLSATLFEPARLNALIDQLLGGYMPTNVIAAMKEFGAARRQYVLSQIQSSLWATADLPLVNWHLSTTNPSATLRGAVDASRTSRVLVGGLEAQLNPLTGLWSIDAVSLNPGVNRLLVRALDSTGVEVGRQLCTVWFDNRRATSVSGKLSSDATWRASNGPYVVVGDVVVPVGVTLRIEPGTSVFIERDKRILVSGRLLAEGTDEQLIRFTTPPSENYSWGGMVFEGGTNRSSLRHVEMVFLNKPTITLTNSNLLIEDSSWAAINATAIQTYNSSLVVRRSVFPGVPWNETVEGLGIPDGGQVVFEDNYFGAPAGYTDVIDFTGGHRPGPIIQIIGNIFAGGGDDGLDLDGTDAHIEGNVFMHFHKDNDTSSESSAISTGIYESATSSITVVRNVFFDNDYDIVLKERARLTAQNNTFVASKHGSLCFKEPLRPFENPPLSAVADGCIWWSLPVVMAHLDTNLLTAGTVQVRVDHSILPEPGPWSGVGNTNADPRFQDLAGDFHLRPGSPALGGAPFGLDMGAYVPAGATICSTLPGETWRTDATFAVGGPGITHYKYRLDGGPWSTERLSGKSFQILGLADGQHMVEVLGKNSAGVWQDESLSARFGYWTVNRALRRILINEILAQNNSIASTFGGHPDLVELHNDSSEPADLSGMSLTDDPWVPRKFVFPQGASIPSAGYLVLAADQLTGADGYHLGFALSANGDSLYMYDRPEAGGGLLESVSFGLQIPDLSIGRLRNGQWGLTRTTFGAPNAPHPLGDPNNLRINEWLANTGSYQPNDFIELFNPEAAPVEISNFTLTDEPIGAASLHRIHPLSFVPAFGFTVFIANGQSDGPPNHVGFRLNAAQGTIGLFSDHGRCVDMVIYGPQAPGISQGRGPSGANDIATFVIPTPGSDSPPVVASDAVVINEVMANNRSFLDGSGRPRDWVEIHNTSQHVVDLAGLRLSDRLDDPNRWVFPTGAAIQPNGFITIYFDATTASSDENTGFGLSARGDGVFLFDREGQGPTRVLDAVSFGVQAPDYTIGRVPDGTGSWTLNRPTPGITNVPTETGSPSDLRINEWMANPPTGSEDWIELYNPSPFPVAVAGLHLTDDLATPKRFAIPPLSFIGVGVSAYQLFVADSDETAGPNHLNFKLSAGGESIGLADADGRFVDSIIFGAQEPGVSEGRFPDGSANIATFAANPTPGRRNSPVPAPDIALWLLPTHQFLLVWNSVPGQKFIVESTTTVTDNHWERIGNATATETETVLLVPLDQTAARYYRVLVTP